ncbi:hypothetical protein AABB24_005806, partial [Solanum stoloniferum]
VYVKKINTEELFQNSRPPSNSGANFGLRGRDGDFEDDDGGGASSVLFSLPVAEIDGGETAILRLDTRGPTPCCCLLSEVGGAQEWFTFWPKISAERASKELKIDIIVLVFSFGSNLQINK